MNQAEYERREALLHQRRLAEIESAPLGERQEARLQFLEALRDYPGVVGERAGWLLEGCYGFGACQAAKTIQATPRMNREAALCQLVAALEWMCPAAFARQAWKQLTPAQQKRANAAISKAMETEAAIS